MKKIITFISLFLVSLCVLGAEITSVTSKQVGNNIEIEYEIIKAKEGQLFDISIYCSVNGEEQANPLGKVTGDVGSDVLGNGKKSVTWNVVEEYGALHGDVKFKVVAVPTKILKASTSKFNGMTASVSKCTQKGNTIEVVVQFKNGDKPARFDLYTNYIKATGNDGSELYAVDYVNGMDKVTTKRPITIGANQTKELVIHFDANDKQVMYLSALEIESRFPSDFAILTNILISK